MVAYQGHTGWPIDSPRLVDQPVESVQGAYAWPTTTRILPGTALGLKRRKNNDGKQKEGWPTARSRPGQISK